MRNGIFSKWNDEQVGKSHRVRALPLLLLSRKLVSTAFIYKLWEVIYNRDGGSVVPKNKVVSQTILKKNHQESAILALKFKIFSYLKKIRNLNFGAENKYKKSFFKGLIWHPSVEFGDLRIKETFGKVIYLT